MTEFAALLAEQQRVWAPIIPDTLTTRDNLASWRGEGGDIGDGSSA